SAQRDFPECLDERPLKLAMHPQEDFISLFPGQDWLLGSFFVQRGEDVGNGQHPDDVLDAFGAKGVWISASIEKFVMMSDGIENFRGDTRISFQHLISRRGMGLDQGALLGIEASRLVEHGERNLCLPDVVKHRGRIQALDVGLRHTAAKSKIDRYSRNQKAVLIGSLVVAANRLQLDSPSSAMLSAILLPARFALPTSMGLPLKTAENIDAMAVAPTAAT